VNVPILSIETKGSLVKCLAACLFLFPALKLIDPRSVTYGLSGEFWRGCLIGLWFAAVVATFAHILIARER
jgi:hypothetical protein